MKRFAWLAWAMVSAAGGLHAQSVSPPLAEYQERARSSFQLQNGSIYPIVVVLEVRGFGITEQGEVQDLPLDTARVHVKLSEMSFRLPPRSSHTVFYEASSDSLPAWFNILSTMSGAKTANGLSVRILLPHVVYLNQKQPLRKDQVVVRQLEFDSAGRKARLLLENTGPNLGRVYQLTVSDGRSDGPKGGAFPLIPHQRRWVELPWTGSEPPARVQLRCSRFSIDTTLSPSPAYLAADSAAGAPRP